MKKRKKNATAARAKPSGAKRGGKGKRATQGASASGKRPSRVQLARKADVAEGKEAQHFVKTLKANKQLALQPGPLPPGTTHQLELDASGTQHVVRKRYSAL
jgi:hypothetical protein